MRSLIPPAAADDERRIGEQIIVPRQERSARSR
jgi:hypothetical protein